LVDKFTIEIVGHHCVPKVKVLMIAPTLILARRGDSRGKGGKRRFRRKV